MCGPSHQRVFWDRREQQKEQKESLEKIAEMVKE